MLVPLLALATLSTQPSVPLVIDDLAPRSALDGWCLVMEVLDRFRAAPYGLRIEGAHVPQRSEWLGEPLARPFDLPPLPVGVHALRVSALNLSGGGLGEDATCQATLGLALVADDALGAALLLEHLQAHFAALPGVTLEARPQTEPLAEEAGLSVQALRLDIDLWKFAPQRRASEERFFSTEVAVRAIGNRQGSMVRGVRISPRAGSTHDGAVHSRLALTPARGASRALPTPIFHFLARLEATDPELWPTRIELTQPRSDSDSDGPRDTDTDPDSGTAASTGWRWKVDLESRRPFTAPPAPALPSALDALTILREVLAGFRADPFGVSVTGIFPDRARSGAGHRLPAIGADGLRHLSTTGGFGIEIRALVIDAGPRSQGQTVKLIVDLRCTAEGGVVEGTRLFEFLARSLRNQPELVSINQPRVSELSDGSGVSVRSLNLLLRIPGRPAELGDPGGLATSPMTHIRGTAALDGIGVGSLSIDVSERARTDGSRRQYYRLRPQDKQASFELGQALGLFWTLEREEPGYTLSSFRISPPGKLSPDDPLPGRWIFEATLSTLNRR